MTSLELRKPHTKNNIIQTNKTDNKKKVVSPTKKSETTSFKKTRLVVTVPNMTVHAPKPVPIYRELWHRWQELAKKAGYTDIETGMNIIPFNKKISQLGKLYGYARVEAMFEAWFLDQRFKEEREKSGMSFLSWFLTMQEVIFKYVEKKSGALNPDAISRADRDNKTKGSKRNEI